MNSLWSAACTWNSFSLTVCFHSISFTVDWHIYCVYSPSAESNHFSCLYIVFFVRCPEVNMDRQSFLVLILMNQIKRSPKGFSGFCRGMLCLPSSLCPLWMLTVSFLSFSVFLCPFLIWFCFAASFWYPWLCIWAFPLLLQFLRIDLHHLVSPNVTIHHWTPYFRSILHLGLLVCLFARLHLRACRSGFLCC